jgi:hypothetical protein
MPISPRLAFVLAALVAPLTVGYAQTISAASADRARVIAASFSKSKHVSKEKRGVRKEKFLEVRSTPAVNANPAAYTGKYQVEGMAFTLDLRVASDGSTEGSGYEPIDTDATVMRRFTLRGARIQGALLTGTKVYADGAQERIEGVFMDRHTATSPSDKGTSVFGLGVMGRAFHVYGVTMDKLFFQRTQ